jgi:phosphatidylserine/phosphatidylglycerophosphate/cardiolipin synthase-like enzyme
LRTENWLSFGSTNITLKAFKQLAELNLFVKNDENPFARALNESVEKHFAMAEKVTDYNQIKYDRLKTAVEGLLV